MCTDILRVSSRVGRTVLAGIDGKARIAPGIQAVLVLAGTKEDTREVLQALRTPHIAGIIETRGTL
jgi:hypothetical protein